MNLNRLVRVKQKFNEPPITILSCRVEGNLRLASHAHHCWCSGALCHLSFPVRDEPGKTRFHRSVKY
jgi:hypothetical protein